MSEFASCRTLQSIESTDKHTWYAGKCRGKLANVGAVDEVGEIQDSSVTRNGELKPVSSGADRPSSQVMAAAKFAALRLVGPAVVLVLRYFTELGVTLGQQTPIRA